MQVRGSNTLSVAMLDNGNYQVADEGEAQTMTETQLNARIANQGFKAVDGDVFIGGQRLGSSASSARLRGEWITHLAGYRRPVSITRTQFSASVVLR